MASSSSSPSQSPTPPSSPSPSQSPTPPSPSHSGEKFLVIGIGFDCDAVELRTLSKLGFPDAIHLVDAIKGGKVLIVARKPTLESEFVTKVTYDCKRDSEIAYALLEEQEGQKRFPDYISLVVQYRDILNIDGNGPEEEILSVLDVPPDKMEALIMAIKESCNAEILIGGPRGPPNKVFIIGPVKQVKQAEDMLRGGVNMNILDKKSFTHFYEKIEEIKDKEMVDPFEGLSNELILHIQRSFTTKDLTATMQLSKRWLDLWLQNPGLKFQHSFNHNLNNSEDVKLFANQVDRMIGFRFGSGFDKTHPVVDFEISLDYSLQMYTAVKKFVAPRLFGWIVILRSKGVTRLTIKMGMIPSDNIVSLHNLIPRTPLTSLGYMQLIDLKLHGLCFPNLSLWKCNTPLLQNLSICWVFFEQDTHFVSLLGWFPKLRTLSAIDINALEIVEKAEGFYKKSREVSLPNLESSQIYGCRCLYDLHAFSAVRTLKLEFGVSYAGGFPIFRNLLHLTLKENTPSRC